MEETILISATLHKGGTVAPRNSKTIAGVSFPRFLVDVEHELAKLLSDYGVTAVTTDAPEPIRGRSYEMSLVLALNGDSRPATGVVMAIQKESYGHQVQFGPIVGINLKEALVEGKYGMNLLDYRDIPVIKLKDKPTSKPPRMKGKYRIL